MSVSNNTVLRVFQRPVFVLAVRILLGGVFIYAGASKFWDLRGFALIIEEFDLVPLWLLPYVAVGLPSLEVLAGAGLVLNVRGSLAAVTGMTVLFMGVLGYAMYEGLVIADCGCFSPGELPAGYDDGSALKDAFIRDAGLLLACCFLFVSSIQKRSAEKIL